MSRLVPVSSFTTSTSCDNLLAIRFTDTSRNNPMQWLWDFGDNSTSTAKNPLHVYDKAGMYRVSLTTTNTEGSNQITRFQYVTPTFGRLTHTKKSRSGSDVVSIRTHSGETHSRRIHNEKTTSKVVNDNVISIAKIVDPQVEATDAPIPDFTFTKSYDNKKKETTVYFTDTSKNGPVEWFWNFGGSTSTLQNPELKSKRPRDSNVTLVVINEHGSKSITKHVVVTK